MKTKHLFAALMLPAAFAACTQEEVVDATSNNALKERVSVGNITFVAEDGLNSRFAPGEGDDFNGYVPSSGDVIGAVLVDQYATTAGYGSVKEESNPRHDHMALYELTNNINTNYAFKQQGDESWGSEAKMVEGNYLLYLPYNAKHNNRAPLTTTLPNVQKLTVGEDGAVELQSALEDVFASEGVIMGMASTFVDRGDEANVAVKFRPIYAYPLVSIVNGWKENTDNNSNTPDVGVDVIVKQIVIMRDGTPFVTSAPINAMGTSGKTILNTTGGAVRAFTNGFSYINASGSSATFAAGSFIERAKPAIYGAKTSDLLGAATAESNAIVLKPTVDFTIAPNQKTEFYAVIPADAYNSNELEIHVLTNKGTFVKQIENPAIAAGRRYPIYEYDETTGNVIAPTVDPDGSLVEDGKGSEYQVLMNDESLETPSIVVTSTEDLVEEIRNAVANEESSLDVTTLSKDVCFDAAAARAFKSSTDADFNLIINGDITITSGLANNTVVTKTITIKDNAYINGTGISLNEQWEFQGDIEVSEGSLTLAALPYDIAGKMVVKSAATVTIGKSLDSTFEIENAGILNTSSVVNLVKNEGTVNIGSLATSTSKITLDWDQSFVNAVRTDVETSTPGVFNTVTTAGGNVNVAAYCTLELTNSADVLNNGTMTNSYVIDGLINWGTVYNYGTVKNTANKGDIELKATSAVVSNITKIGSVKGYIDNNIDVTTAIDATTMNNQFVTYTFDSQTVNGGLYPQAGKCNTIVLKNTNWNPTADQDLSGYRLELSGATISVYTPNVEIKVQDVHVLVSSVVKGSSSAYWYRTGALTNETNQSLTVSNITQGAKPIN